MTPGMRDYILGITVGAFCGALFVMLFIGFVIGARFGAYINFKLNDRGELMTHDQSRCKTLEAK